MVAIGRPVSLGAFAPDKCPNNDSFCISERIVATMRKSMERVAPISEISPYMNDFLKEFINGVKLIPVDEIEVAARQTRPTQRRIIESANAKGNKPGKVKIQASQKEEIYPSDKPPRNISVSDEVLKVQYSRFLYALSEHLKTYSWYAFGKTPPEVAVAVMQVLRGSTFVVETDFTRFDGTKSYVLQELHTRLLGLIFADHKDEVLSLFRQTINVKGKTTHGIEYFSGSTQQSGCADTAVFNSIDNKFSDYLARRLSGQCHDESFFSKTLVGGDDGITADIETKFVDMAAAKLGLIIKAQKQMKGGWTTFLARYYTPATWEGALDSASDIKRQVPKIFITTKNHTLSENDVLIAKALSWYIDDINTPILGDLAKKVIELINQTKITEVLELADVSRVLPYGFQQRAGTHYPNKLGDYALEYISMWPEFDYEKFQKHVSSAKKISDLLFLPLCTPEDIPRPTMTTTKDEVISMPKAENILKETTEIAAQAFAKANGTAIKKPEPQKKEFAVKETPQEYDERKARQATKNLNKPSTQKSSEKPALDIKKGKAKK